MFSNGDFRLDSLKVLLVDDDVDNLQFLAFLFEVYGAEVAAVMSADYAFQAVLEWRPDILISDIGLYGESGYTLIRRIRELSAEKGGQTAAIALTGSEDQQQALVSGYQQHLSKPVDQDALLQSVVELTVAKT